MAELFHFRCHIDTLCLEDFVTFLQEECDVILIVKEVGKRPHIHSTISLKSPKSTFVEHLKKKFPSVVGNKSYSCEKVRELDKNYRYCYKGVPNDYPDIVFTTHTEEQWKDYYNRYWLEQKNYKQEKIQSQHQEEIIFVEKKIRTKTFMVKLKDTIMEDYISLVHAIWFYEGYKDAKCIKDDLRQCQDELAIILYEHLGKSVKNIDDFIFERMYRGLYAAILVECPEKIYKSKAISLVTKFREKI